MRALFILLLGVGCCAVPCLGRQGTGERAVLWQPPGPARVEALWRGILGPEGAPQPPYAFINELSGGTNPKVLVRDARGEAWIVKWGPEVNAEVFASRLAWATGYHATPVYHVRGGRLLGVGKLGRADRYVKKDGSFPEASFKRIRRDLPLVKNRNWAWTANPFLDTAQGRRQLNGLKVVMMLVSNWDAKDGRDALDGANTAIFRRGAETVYGFDDWGASLGKWGGFFSREKWDCDGFAGQTDNFLKGTKQGLVGFGFAGKHTDDLTNDIPVRDVAWLLPHLERLNEPRLQRGLVASGATPAEAQCFAGALRARVRQLSQVVRLARPGRDVRFVKRD